MAILAGCVLIVGPNKVATVIREALGYIPGFGVVRTTGLRVLAEPAAVSREGVTVTINSVVADSTQTIVRYSILGVNTPTVESGNPPDPNLCTAEPLLRLPDSEVLASIGGGGMNNGAFYDGGSQFPSLPDDAEETVLLFSCLPMTLPGTAPENWEIPFRLVGNPATPTMFPVQSIETSYSESATPAAASSANPFWNQISLAVDGVVRWKTAMSSWARSKPGRTSTRSVRNPARSFHYRPRTGLRNLG